jgi:phosphatidylserine decarboxylase
VTRIRRILLGLLPKVALSRSTGLLTRIPLPRGLRGPFFRWFARRYGADLGEVAGPLAAYRSLAAFFQRPLVAGARPVAGNAALVWPCDGRIVSAGPLDGERIRQVKGVDYALADLVGDAGLAGRLAGGSQATIYLAPGDYHRVHAPFDARITAVRRIRGTLFPVNPPAVRAIDQLFVRNARLVFEAALSDGRAAAVVMVGALNVGDIRETARVGAELRRGDEVGRFGFGSTTVVVLGPGGPGFAATAPETVVRTARAAAV